MHAGVASAKIALHHGKVLRGLKSSVEQTWQRMLIAFPLPIAFDLEASLILAAHLDDVGVSSERPAALLHHETGLAGCCKLLAHCLSDAAPKA